ncbi:MAG: TonB family protein [Bacteroidetes bacterium]|nr:TonB family protein [Bacteroidota bacterium]
MKTLETIQNELRDLIAQGIDLTLAALKKTLIPGTDRHNDLILLEGRYQDVSRQLLQGIIANEEATLEFNKIRKELLDFINGLKESDIPGMVAASTESGISDVYNGEVIYRIPKKMQLGIESECIVRLAFDRKVILHDFEIHVGDVMKDLRISDVMGVELLDPNADKAFTITTLNDTVQFVEKDLVTEWIFCVTPLKAGEFPLVLKISIIEIINGIERKRNEVLKEQVQIVTEKPADATPDFVSAGYSWHVTNSEEQRAVPLDGVKGIEPQPNIPAPAPPSPSVPPPSPVPMPQAPNASKALGLGFIGRVAAAVVVLVIGSIALRPYIFDTNPDINSDVVDNSPAGKLRKLRSNPSRADLEAFIRENPTAAEATTAMMLLDSLEDAAWQSALASNESEKVMDYLNEYPLGKHASEAAQWLDATNRGEEDVATVDSTAVIEVVPDEDPHTPKPARPNVQKQKPKIAPKPTSPNTSTKPPVTKPPVEKPKTDPVKPAPEDPNKPVPMVSAARRPVFKKCNNSNKEKEEKCTEEKIYLYLKNGFSYPQQAMDQSIEGTVVVSFVVERNGSITEVKALNDIGGGCAKEAVRLIKTLPKFKPGLNGNGEPIRVQYTQPVRFSLR